MKRFLEILSLSRLVVASRFRQMKLHWKIVSCLSAVVVVLLIILVIFVSVETPSFKQLQSIRNPEPSVLYTADSVLIGRYVTQERTVVDWSEISPAVFSAVIATEDIRFYKHNGVDYKSLARVLVKTLLMQDESSGGGSTITQQLAKNIYPRKKYMMCSMLINKLKEINTARRLEKLYTKRELLLLYLNTIPFADNVYGIEAAAKRFFSVSAKQLNATQAALLVGMLKATHNYNPRLFPETALARRNIVLGQMKRYNLLSEASFDSLRSLPLSLQLSELKQNVAIAPYIRDVLKNELERWLISHKKQDGSDYNLYTDGLKIYTTIDSRMQEHAEKAVASQMKILQTQFDNHWHEEEPWKHSPAVIEDAVKRTGRYKSLKAKGLNDQQIWEELAKPMAMRVFSWSGTHEREISPIDSIRHHTRFLNAGFIAMEPGTGAVRAWVGGIDYEFFQYDHVKLSTKRQVGSIFKPIVYAAALEKGISPCEFISAGQQTYIDDEGEEWTPRNTNYDYPVQYSMKGALAYSVNTVSVKLINRAGIENTISLAKRMGIQSEIPDVPSIALGSPSISLLEMTTAYSTIANEGYSVQPQFIAAIHDRDGNVLQPLKEVKRDPVISKGTAALVRNMMQTVVQEGTASRLRWRYGIYNDIAGKTGTTQANADGWFMAITPNLVMGSWVGADDPRVRFRDTQLGQGANTALPTVAHFMKELNRDQKFRTITRAKFPALEKDLRRKVGCDLYELSDALWAKIEKTVHKRDSIINVDTTASPPPVTFLQALYERKRKILLAAQAATIPPGMIDPD